MSFSGSGLTELAHAVRTTPLTFTPTNGLTLRHVPFDAGQECRIPRLNRPIYLHGWAILDYTTAALEAATVLSIARGSSPSDLTASLAIESAHGPGNGSGSAVHVFHRIEPNTPGNIYFLYAGSTGGEVNVFGQPHAHAHLLAFC